MPERQESGRTTSGRSVSPEYAALLASMPDQRKPWLCCKAPGPQGHLCTERAVRQTDGSYSHTGEHVAEGRAEGERDSVIVSWTQGVPS